MIRASKFSGVDDTKSLTAVDGWARLAVAVLAVAAEDAERGDVAACEWLQSDDATPFATLAGIDQAALVGKAREWGRAPKGRIVIRILGDWTNGQNPCFG